MPEERKTKIVAKRIDLSYTNRPSPMRTLRRVLVVLCALAALAWGGWAVVAKNERMYNPGPVAAVHAMFENKCAECHDGDGKAGFSKGVSDAACLKCHDGAIHSEKQVADPNDPHSLVKVVSGKPTMSANCTTCHVEHKGHDAMVGTSDMLCTRCHQDLPANTAGGKTDLANVGHSFDAPPAHPPFGRVLKQGGNGPWADPTPLKFNHKKHLTDINPKVGDCSSCHRASGSGAGHVMLPVSYDANCKSCHPMTLAANLPEVPHESMDIVRLFTSNVPGSFAAKLATMTPEEKEAALTITVKTGTGRFAKTEKKKVTEQEWLDVQTKDLIEKKVSGSAASNQPAWKAVEAIASPAAKNAAALEMYAAYGMATSCSYCHTLAGSPAGVAKSAGETLRTLPTGYHVETKHVAAAATTSPSTAPVMASKTPARPVATPEGRRWFANSVFDHLSHRALDCASCHAQAVTSTLTSDVLLPDIASCTTCHHQGGRSGASATSNCVACHVYHDKSKELHPIKGRSVADLGGRGAR